MRSTAIKEIVDGIDSISVDDSVKRQVKQVVYRVAVFHGVVSIVNADRLEFVRHLLAMKVSSPTIRDRLMARYSLSRRQAYRIIEAALSISS